MTTHRTVLLDNATLSGVERITGVSQIKNLNYIDNDILCLEKLVTGILFSDRIIAIDDYKDEFRSSRLKKFDYVQFVKLDHENYEIAANASAIFASEMAFSFDGSKPAGDVVSFFEALKIDPQLRWDIFVSSEYLTLSFLLKDTRLDHYERAIESAFRTEMTDRQLVGREAQSSPEFSVARFPAVSDVKDFIQRLLAKNPSSRGQDGKGTLERMVFGYGWAAERSHFYNSIAQQLDSDVYLAPLRDAFCESCYRIDHSSDVISLIEKLKSNSREAMATILEPTGKAKFALRLPFFTSYLISKTDCPAQCIELALQLRKREEFQQCRTLFHNLHDLSAADRLKELNGIMAYLNQSCAKLLRDYAVETANGPQFSMSVGLAGPSIGTSGKLDALLRTHRNRPFSRVFRNIAQDMLNVERLGGLYEKITSSVREHREASHPRISKTPEFMRNRANEHGKPAKLN